MNEPSIVVNGVVLNEAQAMAVRVAVGNMLIELRDPAWVKDLGDISLLYRARLSEVQQTMSMPAPSPRETR